MKEGLCSQVMHMLSNIILMVFFDINMLHRCEYAFKHLHGPNLLIFNEYESWGSPNNYSNIFTSQQRPGEIEYDP